MSRIGPDRGRSISAVTRSDSPSAAVTGTPLTGSSSYAVNSTYPLGPGSWEKP